jgi:hypothetical protein
VRRGDVATFVGRDGAEEIMGRRGGPGRHHVRSDVPVNPGSRGCTSAVGPGRPGPGWPRHRRLPTPLPTETRGSDTLGNVANAVVAEAAVPGITGARLLPADQGHEMRTAGLPTAWRPGLEGKDSTTGHWSVRGHAGARIPTYPRGFRRRGRGFPRSEPAGRWETRHPARRS